jgi:hypothetical protein
MLSPIRYIVVMAEQIWLPDLYAKRIRSTPYFVYSIPFTYTVSC